MVCSDSTATPSDGYTEIFPIEALIFLDPVPPAFLLEQSCLFFRIGLEPLKPGVAGEWDEEDGYEEEFLAAAVVTILLVWLVRRERRQLRQRMQGFNIT